MLKPIVLGNNYSIEIYVSRDDDQTGVVGPKSGLTTIYGWLAVNDTIGTPEIHGALKKQFIERPSNKAFYNIKFLAPDIDAYLDPYADATDPIFLVIEDDNDLRIVEKVWVRKLRRGRVR